MKNLLNVSFNNGGKIHLDYLTEKQMYRIIVISNEGDSIVNITLSAVEIKKLFLAMYDAIIKNEG